MFRHHSQGVFQNKRQQVQHASLGMARPYQNDKNIKTLKYMKLASIKLLCCDMKSV